MDKSKNRRSVIILSVVTIIAFVSGLSLVMIAAHRPATPEFCVRCHSMEPFFNSWKGTVACNAECLDCHTHDNSGKTLSVEMEDKNCTSTGCHPIDDLITRTSQYANVYSFRHETHIKEFETNLRLKCTGCHSFVGRENRDGVETRHFGVDINTCTICHFARGSGLPLLGISESLAIDECVLCHIDVDVKVDIYGKAFDHLKYENDLRIACTNCHFETIHGRGGVDRKSCYYCHTKIPNAYIDVDRMHNDHVKEHKVPCSPCHNEIVHKWEDEYRELAFASKDGHSETDATFNPYHEDNASNTLTSQSIQSKKTVFDSVPYRVQGEIYRGVGGKGVPGSPDPMFLATVNCTACHSDSLVVEPAVCNTCHEKGFDKILKEQKDFVSQRVETLADLIKEARDLGIPHEMLDEPTYNYDLIEKDGSFGVHNIKYTKDLLAFSIDFINEIITE